MHVIPIQADPSSPTAPILVPPWLEPLIQWDRRHSELTVVVSKIIEHLGFTSMVYAATMARSQHEHDRVFFWTTAPTDWVREYDRESYVEIDPRIRLGLDTPPPLIWDNSFDNNNATTAHFFERASHFGIGSGLVVYICDGDCAIGISLNRPERLLTARARQQIESVVGDALHFSYVFHRIFMRGVVLHGFKPPHEGAPLSRRELQCLSLAAHGMASVDIGHKLGIAERTVNFHFSNLISKLGVMNRHEAIAKGVAAGLIRLEPLGDAKRSRYFADQAKHASRK